MVENLYKPFLAFRGLSDDDADAGAEVEESDIKEKDLEEDDEEGVPEE